MSKQDGELELANYWQKKLGIWNGTGFAPLTGKDCRQIKSLLQHTAGISRRIIDFAFQHWSLFTEETMSITDIATCPSFPHAGYLLKHRMIAISLMVDLNLLSMEEVESELEVAPHIDLAAI